MAFGAAIMHEPRVLFLDEPTSGVDPLARRAFWKMINRLADRGIAVLVTTHYLEEAEQCNRLGFMVAGELVAEGTPSGVKAAQGGHLIELITDRAPARRRRAQGDDGSLARVALRRPPSRHRRRRRRERGSRLVRARLAPAGDPGARRARTRLLARRRLHSRRREARRDEARGERLIAQTAVSPRRHSDVSSPRPAKSSRRSFATGSRSRWRWCCRSATSRCSGRRSRSRERPPVVVQDLDQTALSRQYAEAFRSSLTFRVVPLPVDATAGATPSTGRARAAVIIPEHFAREIASRATAEAQLLVDGTDANTALLMRGNATQVTRAFADGRPAGRARAGVRREHAALVQPRPRARKFFGPGIFVLGLSIFPPLLAALAMAREGEQQTILQVYVSSISRPRIPAREDPRGHARSPSRSGCSRSAWRSLSSGCGWPAIRCRSSSARCCSSSVASRSADARGARSRTRRRRCRRSRSAGSCSSFMFSGLIFPVSNIPAAIRWISTLVQARYFIVVVRDAFLQGGGWAAVWSRRAGSAASAAFSSSSRGADAPDAGGRMRPCSLLAGGFWPLFLKELRQIRPRPAARRDARRAADGAAAPLRIRAESRGEGPAARHRGREPHGREPRAHLRLDREPHASAGRHVRVDRGAGAGAERRPARRGVVVPYEFARLQARGREAKVQVLSTPSTRTPRSGRAGTSRRASIGVAQRGRGPAQSSAVGPPPIVGRRRPARAIGALPLQPGPPTSWFIVIGMMGSLIVLIGSLVAATSMVQREGEGDGRAAPDDAGERDRGHHRRRSPRCSLLLSAISGSRSSSWRAGLPRAVPRQPPAPVLRRRAAACWPASGSAPSSPRSRRSQTQAQLMSFFVNPPLALLSGATTPIEAMPEWMQPPRT